WDVVLLNASDPHCSEYPAARWKQAEWLTGFTGEAASVAVTRTHAGLWTDTRYFIQAQSQLAGTGVLLHRLGSPEQVPIPQWLAMEAASLARDGVVRIAVDSFCWSVSEMTNIQVAFEDKEVTSGNGCEIISVPDLIDGIWKDRPQIPSTPVITLDPEVSGCDIRTEKINSIRKWMLKKGCDNILLTALDEIAWVLNVRAADIEYNPYCISSLLLSQESVQWFCRKGSVSDPDTLDSYDELAADEVLVEDYDALIPALESISPEESIFVDFSTLNWQFHETLFQVYASSDCSRIMSGQSPVVLMKAVKNVRETELLRETYVEDGLVLERFLKWLEESVAAASRGERAPVDEWEASVKLSSLRAGIDGFRGESFENISAYGPSAALPHYVTPAQGSRKLEPRGLYLVDSGGQYLTGTTDITRTVPLGPCTPLEMEDYTLVLKGMIELSMAVFPKGTAGCQIDALAREPLWRAHRNFGHGTGHGIGFYLGVHEGPQDIRQNFNRQPLLPGMVTSNEPGLYREGQHGIRHENVILTVRDLMPGGSNEFGEWLCFETLTCCHIDTSAVMVELLTAAQRDWLNEYNASVFRRLAPLMAPGEREWLEEKTRAI
ncbi:MAG: M24 family metallopeptidase, partial [Candidatus Cryptobacteroides sp.]